MVAKPNGLIPTGGKPATARSTPNSRPSSRGLSPTRPQSKGGASWTRPRPASKSKGARAPHEVLGLASETVTPDEVKSAYKKAALATHPDKVCDNGDAFKAVQEAYDALCTRTAERMKERAVARREECERVYRLWEQQRTAAQLQATRRAETQRAPQGPARWFSAEHELIYHADKSCHLLRNARSGPDAPFLISSIRPAGLQPCNACCIARRKAGVASERAPSRMQLLRQKQETKEVAGAPSRMPLLRQKQEMKEVAEGKGTTAEVGPERTTLSPRVNEAHTVEGLVQLQELSMAELNELEV